MKLVQVFRLAPPKGGAAFFIAIAVSLVSGCAHTPPASSTTGTLAAKTTSFNLLNQVCSVGSGVTQAQGVVSMKVKSDNGSGQFSGNVKAQSPEQLTLEVLQPMGGVWATVSVNGNAYSIEVPGKPDQARRGHNVWSGIPLRFATDLFLGKVPCPDLKRRANATSVIDPQDELVVLLGLERFVYKFRELDGGGFWAESLHWEARDAAGPIAVDFKFDDPEAVTRSPLRWEAKSNRGEAKVRWRDRSHV